MTPEFAELRRLAEAATPGPWRTEYLMGAGNDLLTAIIAGRATPDDLRVIGSTLAERDGKFIAAANPAVMLALLDAAAERDALAAKVERVRALHTPTPFWALTPEGYAPDNEVVPPDGVMCLDCSDDHVTDDFENWELDLADGGIVYYPCPTIAALDEEAQP